MIGADPAAEALFPDTPAADPLLFPFETAEPMAPITINARMAVRILCRRNQLRFGAAGGEAETTVGGGAGVGSGAAFIGLPQFGQAAASVETWWPQSSHLTSAM